jgi:hypothetical protein
MRRLAAILIFIIILTGCASKTVIEDTNHGTIDLKVIQNGETAEIQDNTVQLRRAPFSFLFNFSQPDGFLIHASTDNTTYTKAEAGFPLSELPGFSNTSISEELFNSKSQMYLSEDSPSYWYYTDETDHRFNSVTESPEGYRCIREISSIIDISTGKNILLNGREKSDTVYIVIIRADWNRDYTERIELNRKLLKITFNI